VSNFGLMIYFQSCQQLRSLTGIENKENGFFAAKA
jgi:hypothetical protein